MFAPKTDTPHTVWDAFYFILITASTVGYGDITPKSLEAKVVVMIFIIVALSVVPGLIAGTIETLKSSRSGGGSYIQSRGANGVVKQYLVMIGDFQSAKRVADILSGFFNKVKGGGARANAWIRCACANRYGDKPFFDRVT
ncbi:hypothetical protein EDD21DRAFT_301493 [Dissophora ornata]|nr:hypothetical protein EDD21DRAFT_301493 [Dissophora ornata]